MKAQKGFTLVELLVVIGIISLLISILLPTLSKARVAAKKMLVLSNLRQIGEALSIYQGENRGYYPTAQTGVDQDGRAFVGVAILACLYKLPPKLFINPNTIDTPSIMTDAVGRPVLADIGGTPITATSPPTIDAGNIAQVNWHCSFSFDHEKKISGRTFMSRVFLGDRADYARQRSYSGNWNGKGMCLLWTDQHAAFITSKAMADQQDPNIYHHNQYYDGNGNYPGEGATEVWDGVKVTPDTMDTHLRFFAEAEDDALLPNE